MTIFHSEVAIPLLCDVLATWNDWHGELETLTGHSWEEYQALFARISKIGSNSLSAEEESMLRQAAHQFFGYPAISTANLEAAFGSSWKQHLNEPFRKKVGQ